MPLSWGFQAVQLYTSIEKDTLTNANLPISGYSSAFAYLQYTRNLRTNNSQYSAQSLIGIVGCANRGKNV